MDHDGDYWACTKCTFFNTNDDRYCQMCYEMKPESKKEEVFLFGDGQDSLDLPGEWECYRCTYFNDESTALCAICQAFRGDATSSATTNTLGSMSYDLCEDLGDTVVDSTSGTSEPPYHDSSAVHRSRDFVLPYDMPMSDFGEARPPSNDGETRIVLIGRTGSGKSATGNTILKRAEFRSRAGGSSITKICKQGQTSLEGRRIQVIDTPGLYDTGMTNIQITKEIVKCIALSAPGPHAIVLVTRIDRFTQEEQDTVNHFMEIFGEGMKDYLFVLFTRKDDLDNDGTNIQTYIRTAPDVLQKFVRSSRGCLAFNNRLESKEQEAQVRELLDMIDSNLASNGGKCYTSAMFVEAEAAMKRREDEIRQKIEEEKRQDRARLEEKFRLQHETKDRESREVIELLQSRLVHLEQEQTTDDRETRKARSEVRDLKEQISLIRQEAEENRKKNARKHKERMKELEDSMIDLKVKARESAREKVEQEDESALGEVWTGIKKVGSGLWRGIKSIFS